MNAVVRRGRPLHLVEVGLAWPPDTFLRLKLVGLAKRGLKVTVVASYRVGPSIELPGVEVVHMPDPQPFWRTVRKAVQDCARLAGTHPLRLGRLLVAMARPALRSTRREAVSWRSPKRKLREELGWLRAMAPLVSLRPDIVHFEWESAADAYLPIVGVWRRPLVVSSRGGLDLYAQSPTKARRIVAPVSRIYARAVAVHCVSEMTKAEAARHGLDPAKGHVIRSGVDLAVFSPPG
jgi:hypothetical protein